MIHAWYETAQPGNRATDPDIVMPEHYQLSQRVNSIARVVITPVCQYTHPATRYLGLCFFNAHTYLLLYFSTYTLCLTSTHIGILIHIIPLDITRLFCCTLPYILRVIRLHQTRDIEIYADSMLDNRLWGWFDIKSIAILSKSLISWVSQISCQ